MLWHWRPWRARATSSPDPLPVTKPPLSLSRPRRRDRERDPDVVALLGDGVSRTKRTIVAALADRHLKDDVRRTCIP
jgi:hypothetical protein